MNDRSYLTKEFNTLPILTMSVFVDNISRKTSRRLFVFWLLSKIAINFMISIETSTIYLRIETFFSSFNASISKLTCITLNFSGIPFYWAWRTHTVRVARSSVIEVNPASRKERILRCSVTSCDNKSRSASSFSKDSFSRSALFFSADNLTGSVTDQRPDWKF